MPAEATLKLDYSDLLAAKAAADELKKSLRGITGSASGGGGGGAGGGASAPTQEGAKGFREWDTQLRHVQRSGRGVLNLIGIGGGILGVAHLVTGEIKNWYAEMEKLNKHEAGLGAKIAASGPVGRIMMQRYQKEAVTAGLTPEQLLEATQKGNIGEALMTGRAEMGRLRQGASAGRAPETAALGQRVSAVRAAWGAATGGYTAEESRMQRSAIARAGERQRSAQALREAGIPYEGEEAGTWTTAMKMWVKGLDPRGGVLNTFDALWKWQRSMQRTKLEATLSDPPTSAGR